MMELQIDPRGTLRAVYDEAIDLAAFGQPTIVRASAVEPTTQGWWTADLGRVGGPTLGPFRRRSDALRAERAWLTENWLPRAS